MGGIESPREIESSVTSTVLHLLYSLNCLELVRFSFHITPWRSYVVGAMENGDDFYLSFLFNLMRYYVHHEPIKITAFVRYMDHLVYCSGLTATRVRYKL